MININISLPSSINLYAPACSVLRSLSLGFEQAGMAMYSSRDSIKLGTLYELVRLDTTLGICTEDINLLIDSKDSIKYIDEVTIGELDPTIIVYGSSANQEYAVLDDATLDHTILL